MSDKVYVLSKRPSIVKKVYEIVLENKQNPIITPNLPNLFNITFICQSNHDILYRN